MQDTHISQTKDNRMKTCRYESLRPRDEWMVMNVRDEMLGQRGVCIIV